MEEKFNDFKIEVLTQLAEISTKLDQYSKTQDVALDADNRSRRNEEKIKELEDDVKELKDANKWILRTSVGALITAGIGIIVAFTKMGIGLK